ncbi:hypothetical protein B0H13DRAFT_1652107 [Mycena leptocephala]|nr:hypothetical protein B0H13DRAFT_1652107 [Mycena leptocephala]
MNWTEPDHGNTTRVCPGKNMATASIWISMTSMLAVFNITKAIQEGGEVIEPTHEYSAGLAS